MTWLNALYLALRSLTWYRGRTITVILCLGLTLWLPLTVRLLLNQFRSDITARAEATPLVIGAKGSRIDLALHALYFETVSPDSTTMQESHYVQQSGFATAMPLHIRYRTQSVNHQPGAPIVGATIEYFEFRGLMVGQGQGLSTLGDCLLGANVAKRMQLRPGDKILSAPRNAFNLAGDYPLRMNITGVLLPSHSPDDDVVFTDLKTTWIIDGIGHGHQKLDKQTEDDILLHKSETSITASAAVLPFTEITPENIHTFHFHGSEKTFPVSAVIANPTDRRNQTLLLGRYASARNEVAQCVKPAEVVQDLLNIVFRVERLIWISSLLSGIVTVLLLILVVSLSIRLRAAEMQTMFKLGCSRGTIATLIGTEILLMAVSGTVIAISAAWATHLIAADWVQSLLF